MKIDLFGRVDSHVIKLGTLEDGKITLMSYCIWDKDTIMCDGWHFAYPKPSIAHKGDYLCPNLGW